MRIDVLTLFPELFESFLSASLIGKAREKGLLEMHLHNFRDFSTDTHHKVDDTPYGGGPGMVLMAEPIFRCLADLKPAGPSGVKFFGGDTTKKGAILLMAPEGEQLTHAKAQELAKLDQLTLICGRYEGFDARVEAFTDGKLSIGPYVLSGGELAAQVIIETVSRFVEGVVGKQESVAEDTFAKGGDYVEYPQYTRPEMFLLPDGTELTVPDILLSGNHGAIASWRAQTKKAQKD